MPKIAKVIDESPPAITIKLLAYMMGHFAGATYKSIQHKKNNLLYLKQVPSTIRNDGLSTGHSIDLPDPILDLINSIISASERHLALIDSISASIILVLVSINSDISALEIELNSEKINIE